MSEASSSNIIHQAWCAECDGLVKQIRKTNIMGKYTLQLQEQLKELVNNVNNKNLRRVMNASSNKFSRLPHFLVDKKQLSYINQQLKKLGTTLNC